MPYVNPQDRNQMQIVSLDSMIEPESEIRVIDAFVNALDLNELGFSRSVPAREGRPAYDPRALLKLYIYGVQNDIRSSRKLEKACRVNLEVRWLMNSLTPDFRTISGFRKENAPAMKKVFLAFNKLLRGELQNEFFSVDGSKFFACNSKERNFTRSKLDDRICWLEGHIDEYIRLLEQADDLENPDRHNIMSREELTTGLQDAQARLELYLAYQKKMDEEGLSQISLTDPDANLMKMRYGFGVSYNVQTAVSSESHLIADYQVTTAVTDYGQLAPTLSEVKEEYHPEGVLEAVADSGYQSEADMRECLENGIIPHVILPDGKDTYEITVPYEESAVCNPESTEPEELRKCLHAGIVPDIYKDVIKSAVIRQTQVFDAEESATPKTSPFASEAEMREKAEEGYFVRDPEKNIVYCPGGQILRQVYITQKERIRYTNKQACKRCPNRKKCYKGSKGFREIEFNKDEFAKANGNWLRAEGREFHFHRVRRSKKTVMTVVLTFQPDRRKMVRRKCLSEHPFGTIKRSMHGNYFLLRGKEKVAGEFALLALGYNIRRALRHFGYKKVMGWISLLSDAFYSVFKEQVKMYHETEKIAFFRQISLFQAALI